MTESIFGILTFYYSSYTSFESKKELEKLEKLHPQKITPSILEKIESLRLNIDQYQKKRMQGALLRSKFPKIEENEPNISFLNSLEKRKGEENSIFSIYDEETNNFSTTTEEIKETIYNFYSKLYKKE